MNHSDEINRHSRWRQQLTVKGHAPVSWKRMGGGKTRKRFPDKRVQAMKKIIATYAKLQGVRPFLDGPVVVTIVIYMLAPTSWSKKKRKLADEGLVVPIGQQTGDWDNHGKMVCDALNNGIGYTDDRQVFAAQVEKQYVMEKKDVGYFIMIERPLHWQKMVESGAYKDES